MAAKERLQNTREGFAECVNEFRSHVGGLPL